VRLEGRAALVTGAARGIGRAISVRFAQEGADVAAMDLNGDGLAEVAAEIRDLGRRCLVLQGDVSQLTDIDTCVCSAMGEFGEIDVLVNNAAVSLGTKSLFDTTEADWDFVQSVNLKGSLFMMQRVAREMARRGHGRIVNIASISALGNPRTGSVAYASTKGGVVSLTKVGAQQLARSNITVNAVCPGFTLTPMTAQSVQTPDARLFSEAHREQIEAAGGSMEEKIRLLSEIVPLGRINTPEDLAGAVLFFASDDAANVTGQILAVDGGLIP
jgi:2-hydroxycyclohexanecarboxyl-CoA dehydrogenase